MPPIMFRDTVNNLKDFVECNYKLKGLRNLIILFLFQGYYQKPVYIAAQGSS